MKHDTKEPRNTPPRRNNQSIIQKLVAAYKLWREMMPHLQKSARYTLGEKIDVYLLDTTELLFSASYAIPENRISFVRAAGAKLDLAKFFLQIAWETKSFDSKKYIAISERLDEIGRMLGGWIKQLSLKEIPPRAG
ncbi:MAG: four helix bundle protein [Patescibacteria group bacterium]